MREYALIVGHGRSGTNWLLDLLDASPLTHCRSEVNRIPGSPFQKLPTSWVKREIQLELEQQWDDAVCWARAHMGEGDHAIANPKRHVHGLSHTLGLAKLIARPRIRSALSLLMPRFRSGEWPIPWWVGSQRRLEEAYAVLKINKISGWVAWIVEQRPDVPVLHIVRHPGGRLQSWRNRFLAKRNSDEVFRENRARLREVLRVSPDWAGLLGDIDSMSLAETELWFWRYVTEMIHSSGQVHDRYLRVIYEQLARDPISESRRVYAHCGLPWSDEVEAIIRRLTVESGSIARAWRERLSRADVEDVQRVLEGSFLKSWWDD